MNPSRIVCEMINVNTEEFHIEGDPMRLNQIWDQLISSVAPFTNMV